MAIAYLISEYPARSHTFIRREIELLREKGLDLQVYSLHRYAESEILNEEERLAYEDTWSVFPISARKFFIAHFSCLWRAPGRYFRALTRGFKYSGGGFKGAVFTLVYFAEAIYLAEQLRQQNVEMIHAHFANSGAKVAAVSATYLGVPWVLSLHGTVDFEYPGILWLKDLAHSADFLRCISDYGASQLKRVMPRSEYHKVFVSYCGLPLNYHSIPEKHDIVCKTPLSLLSVGRLSPEKGQVLLIEMALKLQQAGLNFVLDIVGDGPDREMLETECRKLELTMVVNFHGAVDERAVFDFMRNSDIFICSSFMEGLPQVLLESMLLGTPVVAPYIAGVPELIRDHETGMLFPAGNTTALVDAVMKLAHDEVLYRTLMVAGRDKVRNEFMIDQTILPLIDRTRALLS